VNIVVRQMAPAVKGYRVNETVSADC